MNARKQIKQKQHKINKILREMNKNIATDNLWKGRFIVHQIDRYTGIWEDNSGTWLNAVLVFIDKKTGKFYKTVIDSQSTRFFAYDVWREMNNFICDYIKVWDEGRENLYNDATDWNKTIIKDFNKYNNRREF